MRRRHPRGALASLIAGILAACAATAGPSLPWDVDPRAAFDDGTMLVAPAAVQAGELVALTYPDGHDRGVLFAIEAEVGGGWERRAMLLSDANGGQPRWWPAGDEGMVVEMIGITGTGPDRVPIPKGLDPGSYRICTANAAENVCASIAVLGP